MGMVHVTFVVIVMVKKIISRRCIGDGAEMLCQLSFHVDRMLLGFFVSHVGRQEWQFPVVAG